MMFQVLDKSLIELDFNGEKKIAAARPADTMLYIIRTELNLLGTKASCENGDCGTCTVLIDGWPIKACILMQMII
jgi:aerobic carbon-monoxide dehydrogenase small subunit